MSLMPARVPGRRSRVVLALAGALAVSASPALALTDEEVYRTLRFVVDAPGARANGMGGAVIAVADDAGATWSNPAGLAFLDRPQVMLDFRGTNYDDTAESHPGEFALGSLKTPASGTVQVEDDALASPHYVGWAQPLGDRWTIAAGRHEWLHVERNSFASYKSTAFPTFENSAAGVTREALSSEGTLDLMMDVYSVATAFAPTERIALGLTVSAARLDVVSSVENFTYAILDTNGNGTPDTMLKPLDYRTAMDDSDVQFTFAAGVLWRPMDTLALGLTYRDGPSFDLVEQVRQDGVRAAELRDYLVTKGVGDANGRFLNTFTIPDSYGLGIAFGPYLQSRGGGGLTVAVDAVQVEYADMLDGFQAGLNNQLFGSDSVGVRVALEDETVFHFGIGYTWTVGYNNSVHVRGGAYSDPDPSVLVSGRGAGVGAQVGRDDVWHGTLGAGFTLKRGFYSFELDAAADISDLGEQYFGSALFKF